MNCAVNPTDAAITHKTLKMESILMQGFLRSFFFSEVLWGLLFYFQTFLFKSLLVLEYSAIL